MTAPLLLTIYCVLILLASLAGGWVPLLVKLTHRRMQIAVSFVAGLMLGVGLLHMLPHALEGAGSIERVIGWLLGGFLVMFFVERFFSFHHHGVPDEHSCDELADDPNEHEHEHGHQLTWGGALFGLGVHSVLNGMALAASVRAESHGDPVGSLVGLGTFLVIFLHKPFDSMTIGTLMAVGNRPAFERHMINGLFALAIPIGALLFYLGLSAAEQTVPATRACLAFSAGMFLCISLSDLLPELHFHHHDRFKLSAALLLGLGLAWGISLFEAETHEHDHSPAITQTMNAPENPSIDQDNDHSHP